MSSLPGWHDMIPVEQDDGPQPVVAIAYNAEFRQMMNLFRAVIRSGEMSPRVIDLTEKILSVNAANYTVWQYRRDCLRKLEIDPNIELDFMDSFSEENPKNYQIWYHRRAIVEILKSGHREMDFCARVFRIDGKNYHAWAHRQWAIQTFGLWDGELEYVNNLIDADIRNNSAWNHRWFIVHQGPIPFSEELLQRELDFSFAKVDLVKGNESAWNYIRGLIRKHPQCLGKVKERCLAYAAAGEDYNPFLLSLLADICEEEDTVPGLEQAEGLFARLIEADGIRAKSWSRRGDGVRMRITELSLAAQSVWVEVPAVVPASSV